jgi:molybdopterin-guanine dinucleotide biosynthesis protein A
MGSPKALVEVGGRPMARRVADALTAAGCGRVVLVGGSPSWAEHLDLDRVDDRWPGEGPLGGLATALLDGPGPTDTGQTVVLVAACDQPWLDPTDLARLVAALTTSPEADGATARTIDGRTHPFPSAWRAEAGPAVAELVRDGARRADAALVAVRTVAVAVGAGTVADVDTAADLPTDDGGAGPGAGPPPPGR